MRLTAVNTSVAFACGTLWAWLLEDWGVVPSVSLALLVVIWISPAVRRRVPRRPDRPAGSDPIVPPEAAQA